MNTVLRITAAATLGVATLGAVTAVQAQEWQGGYLGFHAGGQKLQDKNNETIVFDRNLDGTYGDTVVTAAGANAFSPGFCGGKTRSSTPGSCSDDNSGFEFGGRAGYDFQFGSFVAGAVVEGSRTDVRDAVTAFSTTPAFYTMERRMKGLGALRGRLGYAMDRTLVYATGGGALAQVNHSYDTSNTVNPTSRVSEDRSLKGYQLGGGLEHKITDKVSIGLEYIYTKLEDDDYVQRVGGPAPATNPFVLVSQNGTNLARTTDDFKVHSVRVTAAYRF